MFTMQNTDVDVECPLDLLKVLTSLLHSRLRSIKRKYKKTRLTVRTTERIFRTKINVMRIILIPI